MPKVLIAPLDWGLGHATRCIPLIAGFRAEGWHITLAAEGAGAELLQSAFPEIPLLQLKGYGIRYAKKHIGWKIVQQIPAIITALRYEKRWLQKKYKDFQWDVIISDNRPGIWHKKSYNIYITHQLHIQTGLGKLANQIASQIHHSCIKKYNELWIPDLEGKNNLAGSLSHPGTVADAVQYIGLISRLKNIPSYEHRYDILFLLSGPEPQRSIFEKIILQQIQPKHGRILLIRGTNDPINHSVIPPNVAVISLAGGEKLNQYMLQSKYIICRSGYTSLMDLMRLHKKALLVPTPKQGEQEYLAKYAAQHRYFPSVSQTEFKIDQTIKEIASFNYTFPFNETDFQQYENIIHQLSKRF